MLRSSFFQNLGLEGYAAQVALFSRIEKAVSLFILLNTCSAAALAAHWQKSFLVRDTSSIIDTNMKWNLGLFLMPFLAWWCRKDESRN